MVKNVVILTGAGISAESGLKTFRDANGLWEGHDVMEVASPQGFTRNPTLVLDFYNQRRRQLPKTWMTFTKGPGVPTSYIYMGNFLKSVV